ncbi:uncharacterized protein BDZ99DRAFT_502907 [Mytilinidion resinicola]|uniref:Uncharacterized protein n=1 Tax=Mytilinidion resinicola TaxID=574789 RepID=A0A6A6Y7F2_9PEZI|nr:uncharacterized protein BDZ99DRAFT_502907 [Mytilinidion resinicola]KAF2804115.1 hypothetical protein BDZ99DRAFT_502907 [Mytilinidion resinicola]
MTSELPLAVTARAMKAFEELDVITFSSLSVAREYIFKTLCRTNFEWPEMSKKMILQYEVTLDETVEQAINLIGVLDMTSFTNKRSLVRCLIAILDEQKFQWPKRELAWTSHQKFAGLVADELHRRGAFTTLDRYTFESEFRREDPALVQPIKLATELAAALNVTTISNVLELRDQLNSILDQNSFQWPKLDMSPAHAKLHFGSLVLKELHQRHVATVTGPRYPIAVDHSREVMRSLEHTTEPHRNATAQPQSLGLTEHAENHSFEEAGEAHSAPTETPGPVLYNKIHLVPGAKAPQLEPRSGPEARRSLPAAQQNQNAKATEIQPKPTDGSPISNTTAAGSPCPACSLSPAELLAVIEESIRRNASDLGRNIIDHLSRQGITGVQQNSTTGHFAPLESLPGHSRHYETDLHSRSEPLEEPSTVPVKEPRPEAIRCVPPGARHGQDPVVKEAHSAPTRTPGPAPWNKIHLNPVQAPQPESRSDPEARRSLPATQLDQDAAKKSPPEAPPTPSKKALVPKTTAKASESSKKPDE